MLLRKHQVVKFVMALIVLFAFAPMAEAAALKIANKSASEIHAIYISDSGTDEWEENIIEGYLLPSGNELSVQINGSYDSFDVRVEDEAGNYEEYSGFPGKTRKIEIHGGGESKYQ